MTDKRKRKGKGKPRTPAQQEALKKAWAACRWYALRRRIIKHRMVLRNAELYLAINCFPYSPSVERLMAGLQKDIVCLDRLWREMPEDVEERFEEVRATRKDPFCRYCR